MSTDAYQPIIDQFQQFTPGEQFQLLERLAALMKREEQWRLLKDLIALMDSHETPPKPSRSILELRGLGKEMWQSVDVDQYIEEERNSWDG